MRDEDQNVKTYGRLHNCTVFFFQKNSIPRNFVNLPINENVAFFMKKVSSEIEMFKLIFA